MFCIFLVVVALIAGIVGCHGGEEEEEEEEEELYIRTWSDLDDIRKNLGGTYFLANNLGRSSAGYDELAGPTANGGKGWQPIGTRLQPFTGTFDGGGHTIAGLYINRPDEDYVGLFGYVKRGVVKNVGLLEVDVTGRNETGALLGHNERGVVGNDLKQPDSTYSTGRVASYWSAGGLVGCNWDGIVGLCKSSAEVSHTSGECYRTGGLVGTNYGDVIYCDYSGNVTGVHEVGGMVGLNGGWVPLAPSGRVINCQGNYTVTGKLFVGGEVGWNLGHLGDAFFEGTVNGKRWKPESLMALNEGTAGSGDSFDMADGSCVGLLVGWNGGTMTNCIGVGEAIGAEYIGGLVGYIDSEGAVDGCFAVATVDGTGNIGPLWGYKHPEATVTNSASVTAAEGMDIATFVKAGWKICEGAPGEVDPDCEWSIEPGKAYPLPSGKPLKQYNLTVSSTVGGEVTSPGEGSFTYYEGRVVNLVAEAEEGYHFVKWTGDVGTIVSVGSVSTILAMDGQYSIVANFAPDSGPGSFVQMIPKDIDSLDPAWGYDTASGEQVQYIYETLLYYDGEKIDEFIPVLAAEWNTSPDGMTIGFKIREGVKFHNGNTLTPEDVEYSIERAMVQDRSGESVWPFLQPLRGGPAWMFFQPLLGAWSRDEVAFADIDNAVEVDADWVVFHLAGPGWGVPFLQILCGPWASIVDKEWCVANGEWDGAEGTWQDYNNPDVGDSYLYDHTNGTGPWKLEEWEPGVQIKLVRNDNYWREPAPFERVITQFVDEWTSRKLALLNGDADFVYVPPSNIHELDGIAALNVYQDLPALSIDAFFFNFNTGSESEFIGSGALDGNGIPTDFLSDPDVRKGFCYAFDYETYIEDVLLGQAQQVGSPIIEGLPFYNPDASMYSLDLAKAEEHLKAAWGGQVWEKGFKLTLLYNSGSIARKTACKMLAENLYMINPRFNVDFLEMDWPTILSKISSGLVPMFHTGWIADYPHPDDFVVPYMHSTGAFAHLQGYGYPVLDQLVENAFKELDPAVQEDMYYELQERYYQDAPGILLAQPLGSRYFSKYVKGFYFNPMIPGQAGPLYYMSKSW